jgi:ceramide glucosyltransferase
MRKALIDEVGGIEAFSCYLAEDFFLAKSLADRGWRLCISSQPAWQNSGVCEINSFQARLTRSVLRIKMRVVCYILCSFSVVYCYDSCHVGYSEKHLAVLMRGIFVIF